MKRIPKPWRIVAALVLLGWGIGWLLNNPAALGFWLLAWVLVMTLRIDWFLG